MSKKSVLIALDKLLEPKKVNQALYKAGLYLEGQIKEKITTLDIVRYGELRESITTQMKDNVCVVTCGAEYGIYIEHGTGLFGVRQDYIYPKNKKVLRWLDENGREIFAKRTKGQPARPFFYQTLIDKGLEIVKIFKREINK
ncbi:MAG: hypothetical protein WBI36_07505 [Erysipelotrichaceae bacterium]|jgi:phage gpG-like protein